MDKPPTQAPVATRSARLPSTRESRPALIALAIVLIVGGALGSAWLALQAGNRAYFLQVNAEVAQGAVIGEDDLTRVSLPEDYSGGVASSRRDDVVGKSASTRLLPGMVLTPAMISDKSGIKKDQSQLPLPVDAGSFARGLQPGAQMALAVGGDTDRPETDVYAELVSKGESESAVGSGSGDATIVVSVDISCLSLVADGLRDRAVTPAVIGEAEGVTKRCEG